MGQIANRMALELFWKLREKLQEKRRERDQEKSPGRRKKNLREETPETGKEKTPESCGQERMPGHDPAKRRRMISQARFLDKTGLAD